MSPPKKTQQATGKIYQQLGKKRSPSPLIISRTGNSATGSKFRQISYPLTIPVQSAVLYSQLHQTLAPHFPLSISVGNYNSHHTSRKLHCKAISHFQGSGLQFYNPYPEAYEAVRIDRIVTCKTPVIFILVAVCGMRLGQDFFLTTCSHCICKLKLQWHVENSDLPHLKTRTQRSASGHGG